MLSLRSFTPSAPPNGINPFRSVCRLTRSSLAACDVSSGEDAAAREAPLRRRLRRRTYARPSAAGKRRTANSVGVCGGTNIAGSLPKLRFARAIGRRRLPLVFAREVRSPFHFATFRILPHDALVSCSPNTAVSFLPIAFSLMSRHSQNRPDPRELAAPGEDPRFGGFDPMQVGVSFLIFLSRLDRCVLRAIPVGRLLCDSWV